jgi:arylsulfatase A-like enzyme
VGYEDWWNSDALSPENGYTTDLVTRHGIEFIEKHAAGEQPFCLYLAHECPHYPYQGPSDPAYREVGNPGPPHGPREDRDVAYREMIESMDSGVGEVMDALSRTGVDENTFVFFFSDNGPAGPGSAGPLRGRKGSVWEGGHRVPAMARMPGRIPAGAETAAVGLGMDLFPTLLDLAEVSETERAELPELDGVSLLSLLEGTGNLPERSVFWRFRGAKAVRRGRWKLVSQAADGADAPEGKGDLLFDLENDVAETTDLSTTQPGVAAELRDELAAWEEDVSAGVRRLT